MMIPPPDPARPGPSLVRATAYTNELHRAHETVTTIRVLGTGWNFYLMFSIEYFLKNQRDKATWQTEEEGKNQPADHFDFESKDRFCRKTLH